jgi:hypothetical protein
LPRHRHRLPRSNQLPQICRYSVYQSFATFSYCHA